MDWLQIIKARKKEKNLTNDELSERSGISIGTLNKLLSGASADPKLSTIIALSSALGISLGDIEGKHKNTPELNESVKKYMELDKEGRVRADETINREYERMKRDESTATYSLDAP